jgi:ATP-dependent Clp protease ATP-binding subunit ClpA
MSDEIPSGPLDEMQEIHQWVTSMFERYTERARRVIFFARYEAVQFGSTTIESEHLLLGLIREDQNLTNRFIRNHAAIESIRIEIEGRTTFREKVSTSIDLPLSNECKRILAYAAEEAERLKHWHIGTEHVLLGILREEKCVAAEILHERGLRLNAIREELARSPVERQTPPIVSEEIEAALELPEASVVPDADTAKRIAEAMWIAQYGADTIARQAPINAELKFNVWIVTGSSSTEAPLFAFILQADGRILSVGGPSRP